MALAGCAVPPPPQQGPAPLIHARIGRTVMVDGPKVTPLAVLEDSRCPMNARCVWAGRVRISARIDLGARSETRELTQGEPIRVADGTLELVEVQPDRRTDTTIAPRDYRFGLRFMGGV
ncbi:hypothetical protein [Novosphingobium album (ex Liu et al. 2023)]|uniref:hypothetical protein n=1 Tax=Novosphingobium album (ex Liu et al. 2023) TaxID=3031130 RepID=UPI0023AF2298|nr:hypothetical protein [Novosphingobium album (ex Liu et al. 2023)]